MKLSGSEIVVQCLKEQGVDTVFGYPGGAILNVYDALYKHSDEITHILTSHEQGASHAADGYARATGKVGVCFATSGPGATNLVTGISTAYMDSVPMVAITCNVTNNLLGKDSFQEVDINGICMPITKYSSIVKDVNRLADTIRRAFQIARSGRPGPVLVDITKDVTAAIADYEPCTPERFMARTKTYKKADIREAVEMIRASRKPFVLIGGGAIISEASDVIRRFIDKIDAPFSETLMAQGAVDQHDPRYTGMPGMHGTKTSNLAIGRCDLLIALGTRFSDRVYGNATSFAHRAKILQIDVDAAEINKNIKVDHAIIGDLREVLDKINDQLDGVKHADWLQEIKGLKEKYPLNYDHSVLTGPMVIEALDRLTDGRAIITTDVGQHQMWAAQYYTYSNPRTFISSGGAGTMGYGLGAAIGAKTAHPDRTVINIAGDGCFRMNMNELATASRYNIPVIEIVLDNHVLGMVRQWQTLFYGARYSATVLHDKVDFCKVAEGFGVTAYRVTEKEEFEKVFQKALDDRKPAFIEVVIDDDDKVFPMCSPGAALKDTFDETDLRLKEGR